VEPRLPTALVGYLSSASRSEDEPDYRRGRLVWFRQGLAEAGYVEGRNVRIAPRWADDHNDRLPRLAQELVALQPVVMAVAGASLGALAAKAATSMIPIVFTTGFDPVELGLVTNLAHPGGNITGVTTLSGELDAKRLELLHDVVPAASTLTVLVNPRGTSPASQRTGLREAAARMGVNLRMVFATRQGEFEAAFAQAAEGAQRALLISTDALFISNSEALAKLAVRHGVPTIFQFPTFAISGGLMSYGGSLADLYRRSGIYTARILNGERPGDLPVQQSTKLELLINMKAARSLGLTISPSFLVRADEVIE